MSHHVYFIECKEYIKIGFASGSLESRLSVLQVGSPFKLKILGSISCDCDRKHPPTLGKQRTCKVESELHAKFLHLQVKNIKNECEWFSGTTELREYIDEHADLYVDLNEQHARSYLMIN